MFADTPARNASSEVVTVEVTALLDPSVVRIREAVQPVSRKSPPTTKFPVTVPAARTAVPVSVGFAKIAAVFTFRVTSPEVPPPVSPVPAVTAVMSPGLDTLAQAVPYTCSAAVSSRYDTIPRETAVPSADVRALALA